MRLKQMNLFVKRNIRTKRRMHKSLAINRNNKVHFGKIQVVSDRIFTSDKESRIKELTESAKYGDLSDKYEEQLLHHQLKPLIQILRVIGSFPVEISTSG
jgi:hypothetical protein